MEDSNNHVLQRETWGEGKQKHCKKIKHLLVQKCYSYKIVNRKNTHGLAEVPELKEYKHSYNPEKGCNGDKDKRLVMLQAFSSVVHTKIIFI